MTQLSHNKKYFNGSHSFKINDLLETGHFHKWKMNSAWVVLNGTNLLFRPDHYSYTKRFYLFSKVYASSNVPDYEYRDLRKYLREFSFSNYYGGAYISDTYEDFVYLLPQEDRERLFETLGVPSFLKG